MPVNIAAKVSYSIRMIVDRLVSLSPIPLNDVPEPALMLPTVEPDDRGDVGCLRALGYRPEYPLERTISDALDIWRASLAWDERPMIRRVPQGAIQGGESGWRATTYCSKP